MRRIAAYLAILCLWSNASFCQYETNRWYFGDNAGLNFTNGTPTAVIDGTLKTIEGVATISDGNGNLLFYTDGCTVYNRNHQQMKNGNNLMGHFSSTQSGIIIPKPNSNNLYYIFTVDETAGFNGFRYSVVDVRRDKGLGEVVKKNVLLYTPTTEKVTAVLHNNNKDYWIITHDWDSRNFKVFLLTEYGLSITPVVSKAGVVHSGNKKNSIGYLKASVNGDKLALCIRDKSIVELFNFDNTTGKVSSPIHIDLEDCKQPYGIEFSPGGNLLYVSYSRPKSKILQFNLRYSQAEDIVKNVKEVAKSELDNLYFALQIAPDGKIYVARYNQPYLGVINNPDGIGPEADFKEEGIYLQYRNSTLGLPNFIQSYFFSKKLFIDTTVVNVSPLGYYADYSIGVPRVSISTEVYMNKSRRTKVYFRTDTLFRLSDLPDTIVNYCGVDRYGKKLKKKDLIIEEFSQKSLHPLLNYIFFDENSPAIPARYNQLTAGEAGKFNFNVFMQKNTLQIYHHILNIIGYRLTQKPAATLTVIGCISGTRDERTNKQLPVQRAESVRDYLVNVWKISSHRIKISARGLPEHASLPTNDPEKAQENARVEMTSNDYDIFAPILTVDTLRESDPEVVRFFSTIDEATGFKSSKVLLSSGSDIISELLPTDSLNNFFDWKFDRSLRDDKIEYSLVVIDGAGNQYKTPVKIVPVNQLTLYKKKSNSMNDVEFDNFSLILFDFAKSMITGPNIKISDYIKQRIRPDSKVRIIGYTDKTGEVDFNRRLSLHRANQARAALDIRRAETYGIGEDILLYDNDLPEGRFYCRTVQIILETPSFSPEMNNVKF